MLGFRVFWPIGCLHHSSITRAGNGLRDMLFPNLPGSAQTIVVAAAGAVEAPDMPAQQKLGGKTVAAVAAIADVTEAGSTL
jgi:hypothetical protein